MSYKMLLVKKEEGIATIIINRPQVLNAINEEVAMELTQAIKEVAADDASKVLVLTGSSGAFSAGGDLNQSTFTNPLAPHVERDLTYRVSLPSYYLRTMPKPTIAMVDGPAVGIGFNYAIACDIVIASERARFGEVFITVGLHPDGLGTFLLPQRVGVSKAFELTTTGRIIGAKEADKIGLVNRVVPVDQLESTVMDMARGLAKGPSIAIGLSKISLYQALHTSLETALEAEARAQALCFHTEDCKEGVTAFLEKRKPVFKGK